MNTISFMSANFVARQLDFNMTRGWGQGDKASNEYFKPIETFQERFREMLQIISDAGFHAMDLWTSHVNPVWATEQHIQIACDLLSEYGFQVPSIAGWMGSTAAEFEATCQLANELACPLLGGSTSMLDKDRPFVVATLKKYTLKLGLENHPEKSAQELMSKIGDGGDGTIGATVDTGWFGTQGYDAAQALSELGDKVFLVHLKDVLAVGAHDSCRYGRGIVPIRECVRVLKQQGYQGAISVEHEPDHFDPTGDCVADRIMLEDWLKN